MTAEEDSDRRESSRLAECNRTQSLPPLCAFIAPPPSVG
jgi:hypothetical protein